MSQQKIKHRNNPKIITKNRDNKENGFLIPIYNVHETFVDEQQHPKQVYLTVAKAGEIKGPHLHKKRWGLFTCIRGNIKIVAKTETGYQEYYSGEDHDFATIQMPAGIPNAILNIGDDDAYILNMPSPAWHQDDQDDWNTDFEDYDLEKSLLD